MKFNPGDRVKFIDKTCPRWLNKNGTVITNKGGNPKSAWVVLDNYPYDGSEATSRPLLHWQFSNDNLQLLPEDTLERELTVAIAPLFAKEKQ